MPADAQMKIDWLTGQIQAKEWWLEDHGPRSKKPWPAHDCDAKEHGLEVLRSIRDDYIASEARRAQA